MSNFFFFFQLLPTEPFATHHWKRSVTMGHDVCITDMLPFAICRITSPKCPRDLIKALGPSREKLEELLEKTVLVDHALHLAGYGPTAVLVATDLLMALDTKTLGKLKASKDKTIRPDQWALFTQVDKNFLVPISRSTSVTICCA